MTINRAVLLKLFCLLFLVVSGVSFAWLGEKTSQATPELETVDSRENEQNELAPFEPWVVPTEIARMQQIYRDKVKEKWPNAKESVRRNGFTYYPDEFSASVSLQFSANEIKIIVPRESRRTHGYDQQAERKKASGYLEALLGMKRSRLLTILESELMLEPGTSSETNVESALVLQELFDGDNPSEAEINRLAHRILRTARIQIHDQSLGEVFEEEHRIGFVMNMPSDRLEQAAKRYKSVIHEYSEEFAVPKALVFAIMHTESHFNPLARSPIPAFGLMQIVPTTAGTDAANMLYKKPPDLSPSFLYEERNNIRLGTAYLNLLYYKYLKNIKNEKSRAYAAIAAYNAGPSNIARAFVNQPRMTEAIPIINSMSDKEVLDRLLNYAPARETREYLAKIVAREEFYNRAITYWK